MKKTIQHAVRRVHRLGARKPLGDRIAIYFHALERRDHDQFCRVIESLRARGYTTVGSPDEYVSSRGRTAWISFDDNYRSWFEALPLLERLEVTATFYINTVPMRDAASPAEIDAFFDHINHHGDRTPLSSDETRAIAEAGHVVGAHTHSHHNLAAVPSSIALDDLKLNLAIISATVGETPRHFAIPFGMRRFFSSDLLHPIKALGFETISYAIPAMQHAPIVPTSLHRAPWHFHRSIDENWLDLEVDGRIFERITGRSAVG